MHNDTLSTWWLWQGCNCQDHFRAPWYQGRTNHKGRSFHLRRSRMPRRLRQRTNGPNQRRFYEDLTPESTVALLTALQDSAKSVETTPSSPDVEAGKGALTGEDKNVKSGADVGKDSGRIYNKDGVKIPAPGPMSGRKTCENLAGLTNLTSEPWSTEVFRKDL